MCPDENTLLRFARGGAGDLPAIEAHLDGCESCRRAVAAAASEQTLPASKAPIALTPGMRVSRYEIERELGRGGMGIVYQARDVTLDRRVALKLLHARRDEAAQARLLREAQVMARLAHPNVVPVFELGEWSGELYLVMELVGGETLETWLRRAKHSTRELLDRFIEAGRGLAAAHAAGVVHRDFKPANVLVGSDGRVRVTDFGLSRPGPALELPPTSSAVVTRDGAIIGTLAYMAPEQLEGGTADERSDQFSFCVALVEALTGQRPFVGDRWAAIVKSLEQKPQLGGIAGPLKTVLKRGLELEPTRRFTSMSALLSALDRARKPRWQSAALAMAGALIFAGFIGWYRFAPELISVVNNAVSPPAESRLEIAIATGDLAEGHVLVPSDFTVREFPASLVTTSFIRSDSMEYVLNRKLQVPVLAGDPLMWSNFETGSVLDDNAVLIARLPLTAGTVLDSSMLEMKMVPTGMATDSVVNPSSSLYALGQTLKADVRTGDLIAWNQLGSTRELGPKSGLSEEDVMSCARSHRVAMFECQCEHCSRGDPMLTVKFSWTITKSGSVENVTPDSLGDENVVRCMRAEIFKWKFPERATPTVVKTFPVVFRR